MLYICRGPHSSPYSITYSYEMMPSIVCPPTTSSRRRRPRVIFFKINSQGECLRSGRASAVPVIANSCHMDTTNKSLYNSNIVTNKYINI